MMFVELVGTSDQVRSLAGITGLELQARLDDLGGGRFRCLAFVTDRAALDDLHARGLTVTITRDEDEVQRRVQADLDMMRQAHAQERAASLRGPDTDDSGGGDPPKP